jgi:antitoxin Phd
MASPITTARTPKRTKASSAKAPASAYSGPAISELTHWKLEDAKARFSEVVRQASQKPQLVTVRGKEAAVILAPEDYRRLVSQPEALSLTEFLSTLDLGSIDIEREPDYGRDIDFFESYSEPEGNGETERHGEKAK